MGLVKTKKRLKFVWANSLILSKNYDFAVSWIKKAHDLRDVRLFSFRNQLFFLKKEEKRRSKEDRAPGTDEDADGHGQCEIFDGSAAEEENGDQNQDNRAGSVDGAD